MTGMAMLAMGNADQGKQQQLEAERLSKLLELAEQEAMIRGDSIGVELFAHGYRFLSLKERGWQAEDEDNLFRPRILDEAMRLSLRLDDEQVYLSKSGNFSSQPHPQIILTADGGADDYEISIAHSRSDSLYFVTNNAEQGILVTNKILKP